MKINDIRAELVDIYGISDVLKTQETQTVSVKTAVDENIAGWEKLWADMKDCRRCRLCETRSNIVFGEGNINTGLMFIGEAPGGDEDKTGRPFVGRAGQLLTKMIEAMKYKREDVYIANVVKCRPPENRNPFKDEVDACIGFLKIQIDIIKPKVIVCLGNVSAVHLLTAVHLLNPGSKISDIRGRFHDYQGIKVMPTFHPAYLLRNETKKKIVWGDLLLVMAELDKNK
ncbi:MAG: uracil-DNA glycosylase [Deferribacteraceae bacterium]|jgi:DNA polymerase|nr:uracil-DNA glycosylase [Deferribacteraceae bacterium]